MSKGDIIGTIVATLFGLPVLALIWGGCYCLLRDLLKEAQYNEENR